jgi:NADPH-dependent glutamate synthase beta subunit-like oxidoreductase
VTPQPPAHETGRSVAIVGSGPAGLAAAQQLRRAGHQVVVFERDDAPGGLLRYGIPEFKMEKAVLDRRLKQLAAEGLFAALLTLRDDRTVAGGTAPRLRRGTPGYWCHRAASHHCARSRG